MISASYWLSWGQTYLLKLRASFRMYWFVQKICRCMYVISSTSVNWTTTSSYQRICNIGNFKFYNAGNYQLRCDCIYHAYHLFKWGLSLITLEAMSSLFPHARNVRLLTCNQIVMANMKWRRNSMKRNVPILGVSNPWRDFPKPHASKAFFLFFLRLVSYFTKPFPAPFTSELYSRLRR